MDRVIYYPNGNAKAFDGRNAVEIYRLAALISALKLEGQGIKVTRGASAMKIAKSITGLKTNKREVLIERLREMLDRQRDLVEHFTEPG